MKNKDRRETDAKFEKLLKAQMHLQRNEEEKRPHMDDA